MKVFSRLMFGIVSLAARNGLAGESPAGAAASDSGRQPPARHTTGVRGETFAYWYLRRHGYTIIARNFTVPGHKGEIDLVGYDGDVLAFVEVKTRTRQLQAGEPKFRALPEDAVTPEKRRRVARMARLFLAERRIREAGCRFDVVAIESARGRPPQVRLHKGAFTD